MSHFLYGLCPLLPLLPSSMTQQSFRWHLFYFLFFYLLPSTIICMCVCRPPSAPCLCSSIMSKLLGNSPFLYSPYAVGIFQNNHKLATSLTWSAMIWITKGIMWPHHLTVSYSGIVLTESSNHSLSISPASLHMRLFIYCPLLSFPAPAVTHKFCFFSPVDPFRFSTCAELKSLAATTTTVVMVIRLLAAPAEVDNAESVWTCLYLNTRDDKGTTISYAERVPTSSCITND